ncbi:MAG: biotin-dependent carboxyltransferase family protein, partial [Actinobacteria bacterium]|nr:biotin-dependent carboxyltransferase family protein [Actinomycetota bacterium]
PARLAPGDVLRLGNASGEVSGATAPVRARPDRIAVSPGPRADWFTPEAWPLLLATAWTVRSESDRVGVRLAGPVLDRRITEELPSEPTRPGAVQVPPDGRPIIFGPDAPVTGGYPVIAVVEDLDAVAQLRPGDTVRFRAGIRPAAASG